MMQAPNHSGRCLLRATLAALLLAVALAGGLAHGGRVAAETTTVAPTAEEALAGYVQSSGDRFAGPCAQTRSPEDIGKVCGRLVEERDALRAYLIGRTFSEYNAWVFLSQRDGTWTIVGAAPLDFADETGAVPWPR